MIIEYKQSITRYEDLKYGEVFMFKLTIETYATPQMYMKTQDGYVNIETGYHAITKDSVLGVRVKRVNARMVVTR